MKIKLALLAFWLSVFPLHYALSNRVPALAEMFLSVDCAACPEAVAALRRFHQDFSLLEYIPVIYYVDGPQRIINGTLRANQLYRVRRFPTTVFNGTEIIQGFADSVVKTFEDNIREREGRVQEWIIQGDYQRQGAIARSQVEVTAQQTPANPVNLYMAFVIPQTHPNAFVVRRFALMAEALTASSITRSATADLSEINADDLAALWFVQDTVTNEVLQARGFFSLTHPPLDVNRDGLITAQDVITFSAVWRTSHPAGDLNEDGIVNGLDLLPFFSDKTLQPPR